MKKELRILKWILVIVSVLGMLGILIEENIDNKARVYAFLTFAIIGGLNAIDLYRPRPNITLLEKMVKTAIFLLSSMVIIGMFSKRIDIDFLALGFYLLVMFVFACDIFHRKNYYTQEESTDNKIADKTEDNTEEERRDETKTHTST